MEISSINYKENYIIITLNKTLDEESFKVYRLFKSQRFITVFDIFAIYKGELPNIPIDDMKSKIIKYPEKTRFILYSKINKKIDFKNKFNKLFVLVSKEEGEKIKNDEKQKIPPIIPKTVTKKVKKIVPKSYKTVVIDPGHGGKDAGAVANKNKKEKDLVLQISKLLKEELSKRGYIVFLTREKDLFLDLKERTRIANSYGADIFISIHANSASPLSKERDKKNGFESYFLSDARSNDAKNVAEFENKADIDQMQYHTKNMFLSLLDREKQIASNKLAIDLQKGVLSQILDKFNVKDGGVREGPFWVLVGSLMPSVLVEVGYISNVTELDRLFSTHYQQLMIKGLADGIDSYFRKNQ